MELNFQMHLTPNMKIVEIEFKNICPDCGKINTLFPYFMGKKRGYRCDPHSGGCGHMVKGITKKEAEKRGVVINFCE